MSFQRQQKKKIKFGAFFSDTKTKSLSPKLESNVSSMYYKKIPNDLRERKDKKKDDKDEESIYRERDR